MIIHPFAPDHAASRPLSLIEEARLALEDLLASRHGSMRIADALMTVAAELAVRDAGPVAASAWIRRLADDVRLGRLQD